MLCLIIKWRSILLIFTFTVWELRPLNDEKIALCPNIWKTRFAVISDSFISCWVCVTHCIVFINVTNCFVNYFPKKWNMFSNYLPILPSHGRIQTITLFWGFFSKEKGCFAKFYPLHKSQEKKICHQSWIHSFWTGGIQGRGGSKMGTQTIFFSILHQ